MPSTSDPHPILVASDPPRSRRQSHGPADSAATSLTDQDSPGKMGLMSSNVAMTVDTTMMLMDVNEVYKATYNLGAPS